MSTVSRNTIILINWVTVLLSTDHIKSVSFVYSADFDMLTIGHLKAGVIPGREFHYYRLLVRPYSAINCEFKVLLTYG
jgi:hypothetical protein